MTEPNDLQQPAMGDSMPTELKEIKPNEGEQPVKQAEVEKEQLLDKSNGNGVNDETERMVPESATAAEPEMARTSLRVYKQRWIVLAVVALLNCTNTCAWIGFANVANHVNKFYGTDTAANLFSGIYMLVTVPVGIVAMWAGRFFGLRVAILIAAWSNCIGVLIRLGSSWVGMDARFPIGLTGQAIAAVAYPFIMFLPTKVAGTWFGADQRGLATTIGVMSNPLGVLLASQTSPKLVTAPEHVVYLNVIVAIPAVIVCLMATVGVNRSEPKTPPTLSAATTQMEFVEGLKSCFTTPQYIVLLIVMGGGIGMFNCLYTVMQQLLCPSGYGNDFSGWCSSLMIIGGVIGATASGIFVDRTKRYTETMKVCMTLAVVLGLTFLQLTFVENIGWVILLCCFFFGILGLAIYPVGLEMSAECTFPVTETTSTGLIVLTGQVMSIIFVALVSTINKPISDAKKKVQVCDFKNPEMAKDAWWGLFVISIIAVLLVVILISIFRPVYKRMLAEQGNVTHTEVETAAVAVGNEVQHEVEVLTHHH
ncbi:unnamed protein product [Bursaphelenchus okinawaensis]|uniref:Major facilitator superfamily (MFS) profile domain-containing protein n=1 Tax=Bursaphelenchus okinawaensis TaxID=465554 RepID=A0A811LPG4_9BILA|nr:unnamed protein product [Bursaphelenchus okinawaensis]CAG9124959.1 unnamed protein product [Bursaphelenchus okinawaensis]